MRVVLTQNTAINNILPKQLYSSSKEYRFLKYTIIHHYNNVVLLFNVLTREMIALTEKEYKELDGNIDLKIILLSKYFIVEKSFNDSSLKKQLDIFYKSLYRNDSITNYTIMPTLECNARCFYCFEHGINRYPMTNQTACDVASFIIEKCKKNKVHINWFGGEPLFNIEPIDTICSLLSSNEIVYESTMITNGYLFDDKIIQKAISLWNLTQVQITIDGTEEIYNKCKSYIYDKNESPFWRIINNIDLLTNNNIKVLIRINLDNYNETDLFKLVDLISDKFKNRQNMITMYVWLLYDNRGVVKRIKSEEENRTLTNKLIDLENYIEQKGFSTKSVPSANYRIFSCSADAPHSTVILPDGRLGRCDHHSEDELYGSIYSDLYDTNVIESWKFTKKNVELCDNCPLLPQCVKLDKCPDANSFVCNETMQIQKLNKIYRQMKNAYDKIT